jgi:hypothetical protein
MSLFYTKILLLLFVLIIQSVALLYGAVPYFPIEISRTAEASPINLWLFPLCVIILPCLMLLCHEFHNKYIISLIGLILLALFDDKRHWLMHMIGIFIMVLGTFVIILYSGEARERCMLLCCALMLYVTRVVMKAFIVATVELNTFSLQAIFIKSMDIMYEGASYCQYPQYTLPVFQIGGLLQWIVFYIILCAIE